METRYIDGVLHQLSFRKSRLVNGKRIYYKKPFPIWLPVG